MTTKTEAEKHLKSIAELLKSAMPDNMGFALFMFSDKTHLHYASSVKREIMIKAIREWLSHVED